MDAADLRSTISYEVSNEVSENDTVDRLEWLNAQFYGVVGYTYAIDAGSLLYDAERRRCLMR